MVTHLAGLAEKRLIVSFAPYTPYYAVLKRIGELFPGPSKVQSCLYRPHRAAIRRLPARWPGSAPPWSCHCCVGSQLRAAQMTHLCCAAPTPEASCGCSGLAAHPLPVFPAGHAGVPACREGCGGCAPTSRLQGECAADGAPSCSGDHPAACTRRALQVQCGSPPCGQMRSMSLALAWVCGYVFCLVAQVTRREMTATSFYFSRLLVRGACTCGPAVCCCWVMVICWALCALIAGTNAADLA
jgi:Magnesium-protoporphyrin IX methyltransferase C-terminus